MHGNPRQPIRLSLLQPQSPKKHKLKLPHTSHFASLGSPTAPQIRRRPSKYVLLSSDTRRAVLVVDAGAGTPHGPTSFCLGIFNGEGCLQAMGESIHAQSVFCPLLQSSGTGSQGRRRQREGRRESDVYTAVHVGRAKIISKKRFSYKIRRRPEVLNISQRSLVHEIFAHT